MQESRVGNAGRNVLFGMLLRCYQILMPFLMRTAIMYYMGREYLGLNSLFGSVLFVLNLAELGVGSAMVYSMYQPIIDGDKQEICALLKLYRRYYRIIGLLIAVVGTILTPFIPWLINSGVPDGISVYVVYLLNLFCTVMSYWLFAYKNSLLTAHQRADVASKVMLATNTAQYLIQFVVVMKFRDYYAYLIVSIITQVFTNIITAYWAKKMYPEYNPDGELPVTRVKEINGKIKDLFTMKLGVVMVSSVDSITVSAFLGLSVLGIYGNYTQILTAAFNVVKVLFDSCTAGIGNSILTETSEKNFKDLKKLTFIVLWVTGFCCVLLLCLFQPFMLIWTKSADNLFGYSTVICFVIYFFLDRVMQLLITYKDAAGIWHEDRFRPLVTAIVNVVMNIILILVMGLNGVIISTIISILFVGIPWILHNLFTVLFKRSMKEYVWKLLFYTIVIVFVCVVCAIICSYIPDGGIGRLLLKAVVCGVVANVLFALAYFKTPEFAQTMDIVKRLVRR